MPLEGDRPVQVDLSVILTRGEGEHEIVYSGRFYDAGERALCR
jgi:hypothetical protein